MTVTVCAPLVAVVGVPQSSLGSVPGQLPAPSVPYAKPAGRPATGQQRSISAMSSLERKNTLVVLASNVSAATRPAVVCGRFTPFRPRVP